MVRKDTCHLVKYTCDLNHVSDALIYNEDHVNTKYKSFKVIRPTKIDVNIIHILLYYIRLKKIFQGAEKHSLSTECTYKLGDKWHDSTQTRCEAYVYYYPAVNVPIKCVSTPNKNDIETTLNSLLNITLPVSSNRFIKRGIVVLETLSEISMN